MRCRTALIVLALITGMDAVAYAQAAPSDPAAYASGAPRRGYRKLAPGVMQPIDSERKLEETVSRHDIVELLAVDPSFDWAKDAAFRRDIWALQFQFKPLRFVWVDEPQPSGKMERKLVRYLVYSVTNPGKAIRPVQADQEVGRFKAELVDLPVRFLPRFLLEVPKYNKMYPDRFIPLALDAIRQREDPNRQFFNAGEAAREIKVGETLWGVATWQDIYPRIDRFSIYIEGLTNAYQWVDDTSKVKANGPLGIGRSLTRKTLKLNFWRPGDEYFEHDDEVRYGSPGQVDYEWVYR